MVLMSVLNQSIPNYFMGHRGGFPRCILRLRKYTKTPIGLRAVLTVLSQYRIMLAPGKPDLESITSPGKAFPDSLVKEIVSQINEKLPSLGPAEYQLRSKSGPNGPAVFTAALDALALKDSPVMDSLEPLLDHLNDEITEDLFDVQEEAESESTPIHSKLSIKREFGGKDRVFAIVDYYSQLVLKPLHDAMFKILESLSSDYTYDQERSAATVQA